MRPLFRIVMLYALFAALATAANIGTQAFVIWLYEGVHAIALSVLVGTAVGLPVKYILEKHYIFRFKANDLSHDGQLFFRYGFFGIFTTLLFWGVEYLFHIMFATDGMRLLGGTIGLILGYIIKYQLDKRYVFASPTVEGAA